MEIKSVNSRYNEINIKLPKILNSFELDIKNIISEEVSRGKTDVNINFTSFSKEDSNITVDENLLEDYLDKLDFIKSKCGITSEIPLELIVGFDGILNVDKTITNPDVLSEIWETLFVAINNALANFIQMRETEGESLKKDILLKIYDMGEILEEIKEIMPSVAKEHESKLRKKVQDTLDNKNFDENRILTEITIYLDKTTIDEELVRLDSHIVQIGQIFEEKNAIGRKLDFLIQEINREINTIGSKSTNIVVTKSVVELKSIVEKIREQIQNIE